MNSVKVFYQNFHPLQYVKLFYYNIRGFSPRRLKETKKLRENNVLIADVQFNITFNGDVNEYPNYMGFIFFDFNDSETITRLVGFKELSESKFLDFQYHTYKSYGTYYPKLLLTNNISEVSQGFRIEVEQCITDFTIGLTSAP